MVTITIDGTLDQARAAGWGTPNDRGRCSSYLAGLSTRQAGFEYSPEREAQRVKQPEIEIEIGIRGEKRDLSAAGDDVFRRRARKRIAEGQAEMRDFL